MLLPPKALLRGWAPPGFTLDPSGLRSPHPPKGAAPGSARAPLTPIPPVGRGRTPLATAPRRGCAGDVTATRGSAQGSARGTPPAAPGGGELDTRTAGAMGAGPWARES